MFRRFLLSIVIDSSLTYIAVYSTDKRSLLSCTIREAFDLQYLEIYSTYDISVLRKQVLCKGDAADINAMY